MELQTVFLLTKRKCVAHVVPTLWHCKRAGGDTLNSTLAMSVLAIPSEIQARRGTALPHLCQAFRTTFALGALAGEEEFPAVLTRQARGARSRRGAPGIMSGRTYV